MSELRFAQKQCSIQGDGGADLSYACSLLGQSGSGATCDAIAGDGETGVYGSLAMCSPAIKLSYAMSAYFSVNPIDSSCDFGGNASLVENRESRKQSFFPTYTQGGPSASGC